MQNIQKYNIIAILTLSIVAGIFNSISSFAQEGNQTQTATEEEDHSTEAGHSAEEEKEYNNTNTIRDSVTVLLQEKVIPAGDFIHLYDSTPYHIMDGHIALKVPCEDDSNSPIQILVGSAPNMTVATLENVPPLSTPGEQCLYHMDLMPSGNITTLTDIALKNTSEENIEFPPTSTVVIGINEVKKGEHGHSESTEEHAATSTAEAGHTE